MSSIFSKTDSRNANIDALRGLSAILVVVQHSVEFALAAPQASTPWKQFIEDVFLHYCNAGRIGVVAFFLISGFVIPFSFKGPRPIWGFWISRFFRLYPAYWLSIGLGVVSWTYFGGMHFPLPQVIANMTMVQVVFGQKDILGVYWTLVIELGFYAMCCWACYRGYLLSSHKICTTALAFLLLSLIVAAIKNETGHNGLPVGAVMLIALMYLGTLARNALVDGDLKARILFSWLIKIIIVVAPVINYVGYSKTSESWIANTTALYIGLFLFLIAVKGRSIKSHPSVFLGCISYSIYLSHPILLPIVRAYAISTPWPWTLLAIPGITVLSSILMAALIYSVLEKPSIRLGHRLAGK